MKKIIGVDLDEVLAHTLKYIFTFYKFPYKGRFVEENDVKNYNVFQGDLGITYDDALRIFRDTYFQDTDCILPPIAGAYQKLKDWKKAGHTLKIVTGRPEETQEYTQKWIDKHFPGIFESLHFANHFVYDGIEKMKRTKHEICEELGIEILIDDLYENVYDTAEAGITSYLFKKPWNQDIYTPHPNILLFSSWEEIEIPSDEYFIAGRKIDT